MDSLAYSNYEKCNSYFETICITHVLYVVMIFTSFVGIVTPVIIIKSSVGRSVLRVRLLVAVSLVQTSGQPRTLKSWKE